MWNDEIILGVWVVLPMGAIMITDNFVFNTE